MTDKTIRFNVDSREVQDYQSKMRESAQKMAVDMVNYARSQSTSAKETLQIIEEQIRSIEKRNRLDRELSLQTAQQQLRAGTITQMDYGKAVRSIDTEFSQSNLQVKLLRELIEVTRLTSREEIRSDRENAERVSREEMGSNEIENLRRIQTRDLLGGDQSQASVSGGLRIPGGGGQLMTGLLSGNLGAVATGLTALLGGAAVIGAVGAIALNTTRQYENEILSYAVATQRGSTDLLASGDIQRMRSAGLGMSSTEVAKRTADLMRSFGGPLGSAEGSIEGLLGAGVSRGISDDALNRLMSISRFTGAPAIGAIGNFEDHLNRLSKPLIRLPEVLDIYLQKADEILQRGGVLNTEGLQQMIMSVSSSYGVEGYNLNRMVGSLGRAAGPTSSNPIMEALKLQTLQELYPNDSQWDRFGKMEHALSNTEYIQALLRRVKSMGVGGGDSYQRFAVANLLGMGYEDVNRLMEGDLDIEKIGTSGKSTQERNDEFSAKYEAESKRITGEITKLTTEIGVIKDLLVRGTSNIPQLIKSIGEFFEDSRVNQRETINAIRDFQ